MPKDPAPKDPASTDTPPAATRPPSQSYFRKHRTPLARDDARRQGDISQLAFLTMGGRDPAIAFLNNDHAALGGRPLEIATTSAEGYARVADVIRAWPSNPGAA